MAKITNTKIFLASETTGAITDTLTIATGAASVVSREIIYEDGTAYNGAAGLFFKLADDDAASPTITVKISFHNGTDFMTTEHTVASGLAATAEGEYFLNNRDYSWWLPHRGLKIKFEKTGSGAVTITEGRFLIYEGCS